MQIFSVLPNQLLTKVNKIIDKLILFKNRKNKNGLNVIHH